MKATRMRIIIDFACWTGLSALRSGSPVKSRSDIYRLLNAIPFDVLFVPSTAPVQATEFATWHRTATLDLCKREPRLCVGWAAKLINVYLKTAAYVGDLGRPQLADVIHPPIDRGLWAGLAARFASRREILDKTHVVTSVGDIREYDTYVTIIAGCRLAAEALSCALIEVEQLWQVRSERSA